MLLMFKLKESLFLMVFMPQYRTSRLLQSAAVRLRKHTKTLGGFGAWNRCLNHLLTLAESHIESVILAQFIEAVQRFLTFQHLQLLHTYYFLFLSLTIYPFTSDVPMQIHRLL